MHIQVSCLSALSPPPPLPGVHALKKGDWIVSMCTLACTLQKEMNIDTSSTIYMYCLFPTCVSASFEIHLLFAMSFPFCKELEM